MSVAAYPLAWPHGRPRTAPRRDAAFRDGSSGGKRVSLDLARTRLDDQLTRLKATDPILSMNIKLTLLGRRDLNVSRVDPADTGVALYFDLGGKPHVLACDRWDRVADNIAAIAAHIEALRGQERWGVADLRQAFAGHLALAAPDAWWTILGVAEGADLATIERAYRERAKTAHPDRHGSRDAWDSLTSAYDRAKAAR